MRPEIIINRRSDHNTREHDNSPIHISRSRINVRREEAHHESEPQEAQSKEIDCQAPSAQRPSAWEQRLSTKALYDDQRHRSDIRYQKAGVGEGDDGVCCHVGAESKAEGCHGESEDDYDCVDRDVPAWLDL